MKINFIILLFTSFFILCNSLTLSADSSWSVETVDSEGNVGNYNSLVFDSNDHPHIIYYDVNKDFLKHAYWTGSSWSIELAIEMVAEGTLNRIYSLAVDSNDHLHISYFNDSNHDLNYAYHDGNSWNIETVVVGTLNFFNSLALDSNDHPHISYQSSDTYSTFPRGYSLKYAYYDGNSWNIESVTAAVPGSLNGVDNSLALDSNDYPHISYFDYMRGLMYAYYDGNSWNIETVHRSTKVGKHSSLALDSNNHPHISYYNNSNNDLNYAYYDGKSWNIEIINKTGYWECAGVSNSLALDSNDHPHISYSFGYRSRNGSTPPYSYKYAYYDGDSWNIETVDIVGESIITSVYNPPRRAWVSLALDSSDQPHISYYYCSNFSNRDLNYASISNNENEISEENQSNTKDSEKDTNDSADNLDDKTIDKSEAENNIGHDNEKDNSVTPGFEFIFLLCLMILIVIYIRKK